MSHTIKVRINTAKREYIRGRMEFSKHKNYRNPGYLNWLRKQNCLISGKIAQCAHHVRLRTNGGKGLKPSDYFCVPLTHDYHTTGAYALHMVGEESFFHQFKIKIENIFLKQLALFLKEEYQFQINNMNQDCFIAIDELINEIELRRPATEIKKTFKIKKKTKNESILLPKISESDYYKKAQEYKRKKSKELRQAMKQTDLQKEFSNQAKKKLVKTQNNDYYEKVLEDKRNQDKELRKKLKLTLQKAKPFKKKTGSKKLSIKIKTFKNSQTQPQKDAQKEYYEKNKELKKSYEKEMRDKNKLKASEKRKELYKRAKDNQKKYKEESL